MVIPTFRNIPILQQLVRRVKDFKMSNEKMSLKDKVFLFIANASGYIGEAILILFLLVLIFSREVG